MTGDGRRQRLIGIVLDEGGFVRLEPEVERERVVALRDLLEENSFRVIGCEDDGPYCLRVTLARGLLVLDIESAEERHLARVAVSMAPFARLIKEYFMVCENYFSAIRDLTLPMIETIDVGRRSLHDEGSRLLRERLADRIDIDAATSRRLFTLVCILHIRG